MKLIHYPILWLVCRTVVFGDRFERRISGNAVREWSSGNDWLERPDTHRRPGILAAARVSPIADEWRKSTMKRHIAHAICTVAALALATLLAGQAHAACGNSQRIDHNDADCLEAVWGGSDSRVRNTCSEYGTVVAKVDLIWCVDTEYTLTDGHVHARGHGCLVRKVTCCKDLSDLCNKADLVNDESCGEQFSRSPAADSCRNVSAGLDDDDDDQCVIDAECRTGSSGPYQPASTTVSWLGTDDLNMCDDGLEVGEG